MSRTSLLIACGALVIVATLSELLAGSLAAFEPCRILYRSHQPVQDSVACQVHSVLGVLTAVSLVVAAALGLGASVRWLRGRAATHRHGSRLI